MVGDVLQTLIIFGFIAAIVLGSQYFQARKRARVHETIELAMRQGQPVPPELIDLADLHLTAENVAWFVSLIPYTPTNALFPGLQVANIYIFPF